MSLTRPSHTCTRQLLPTFKGKDLLSEKPFDNPRYLVRLFTSHPPKLGWQQKVEGIQPRGGGHVLSDVVSTTH